MSPDLGPRIVLTRLRNAEGIRNQWRIEAFRDDGEIFHSTYARTLDPPWNDQLVVLTRMFEDDEKP